MPDPVVMLQVAVAAAVTAAVVLLYCAWPWRTFAPAAVGGVLGAGLGFFVGSVLLCARLGTQLHWPPLEDKDRWLFILLPAVVGVEVVAAVQARFRLLDWLARCAIAAGAAWIILYQSSYVTDLAGPGSREWQPRQAWTILGGLAVALATTWALLSWLMRRAAARRTPTDAIAERRGSGRSVLIALALTCLGAAVTVMYSGYASGGQLGLPLAGSLCGVFVIAFVLPGRIDLKGVVGLGTVGLFALLVSGRFFGNLTTLNGVLLFFAPLLCWIGEAPYFGRFKPAVRAAFRLSGTAVPVLIALILAQQQFAVDSRGTPDSKEGSTEDYLNFGK